MVAPPRRGSLGGSFHFDELPFGAIRPVREDADRGEADDAPTPRTIIARGSAVQPVVCTPGPMSLVICGECVFESAHCALVSLDARLESGQESMVALAIGS